METRVAVNVETSDSVGGVGPDTEARQGTATPARTEKEGSSRANTYFAERNMSFVITSYSLLVAVIPRSFHAGRRSSRIHSVRAQQPRQPTETSSPGRLFNDLENLFRTTLHNSGVRR